MNKSLRQEHLDLFTKLAHNDKKIAFTLSFYRFNEIYRVLGMVEVPIYNDLNDEKQSRNSR